MATDRLVDRGELVYRKGVAMDPEAKGGIHHAIGAEGDVFAGFGSSPG